MSAIGKKAKLTIHWSDERKLCLLKCVQQLGGHLIGHSGVTKKWSEINQLFFQQDEMLPYASAYDEKNFRKLKDVYEQTIKAIKQMVIDGNTSKFDGDLSSLFNCAKDIIEEVDVQEEEKRALKGKEAAEKLAMEKNETTLLNNNESRKRKDVDGKVRLQQLNIP